MKNTKSTGRKHGIKSQSPSSVPLPISYGEGRKSVIVLGRGKMALSFEVGEESYHWITTKRARCALSEC